VIPGTESSPAELAARAACLDVVEEFYRLVDHGRAKEAAGLFTADAVLHTDKRYSGKDAIVSFLTARDTRPTTGMHVVSGPDFRQESADQLDVTAVVLLYARADDGSPTLLRAGEYTHRCRRIDGRWMLAGRDSRRHPISAG
jgi:hypothetical protein